MIRFLKTTKVIMLVIASAVLLSGYTQAQAGCSRNDMQVINSYIQRIGQLAMSGDLRQSMELSHQLQFAITPECLETLSRAQNIPSYQREARRPTRPPEVYNHGGGTYSVPNLGACGPQGCISF